MGFEDMLGKYFARVFTEVDFVKKTYNALKNFGFNDENAIASVCICRDEISQTLRKGIKESHACGALCVFLGELREKKVIVSIDDKDAEQGHLKMRPLKEIPYGNVPDLLELTQIALKVIQTDFKQAMQETVDGKKSDYALITGIQIHGLDGTYIWPAECYAFVNGIKKVVTL